MTTSAFWTDVAAYSATTLTATALLLVVLATGIRRLVNITFGLLMASVAMWASTAVILRFALWFNTATQQFWMEFSTLGFMLIAPLLLLFSAVYLRTTRRWPYIVTGASLVFIGLFSTLLFRHLVVSNVRLEPSGIVVWDRTTWGLLTSVPLLGSAALALLLFWRDWPQLQEFYLPIAFTVLVVFGLVFSFIHLPFPTLSLVMIVVISLTGYGVLNRQLFNPLRELTRRLEEQVAERTADLEQAAGELETALEHIQRHARHLQTAADVASTVSAIRDVDDLLDQTAHLIAVRFGFQHVGVFLLDDARQHAVLHAVSSEEGQQLTTESHRVAIGADSTVGRAAATGQPLILQASQDTSALGDTDHPPTHSQMALPLQWHGQVVGVLDIRSAQPAAFSDEDVTVLQVVADQLAVGLENARLFAQTQDSLEELSRLYRALTAEAWELFTGAAPELRQREAGRSDSTDAAWEPLFVQARQEGQPVIGNRSEEAGDAAHLLAVPVRLRDVPVGVIGLHRAAEDGEWQPEEIALAAGVAERAALALENARLLEEAQRRAARERLISEVTTRVRQTLDLETVLRTAADEIYRALGLEDVAVQLEAEPVQEPDQDSSR